MRVDCKNCYCNTMYMHEPINCIMLDASGVFLLCESFRFKYMCLCTSMYVMGGWKDGRECVV